ncbi:potassium channel family protein [Nocardioides campestrisoli]|uniref:potassium channel family protein n=1 Tax=Nocardioides campestrisoli TaxID=2736757 RepID=UPI001C62701A|nr:potassium channel family protein [Nocardioides campestrisoli]
MRVVLLMALRITLSLTVLVAAYFLLPREGPGRQPSSWWLGLQLVLFLVVGAVQLPAIIRAVHPMLRAAEALCLVVPLYLLIFARIYLAVSMEDPGHFSEPLDAPGALYLTVSVFATVGFGDIVALSDGSRLLVTLQMLLNLVVLGAGIRLLFSAARWSLARRRDGAP